MIFFLIEENKLFYLSETSTSTTIPPNTDYINNYITFTRHVKLNQASILCRSITPLSLLPWMEGGAMDV